MRDIEKTNMAHEGNQRRVRRRRRGRSAYVLLVVLFAFALLMTLSMTVFFNIEKFHVTGNYTGSSADEIIQSIGVKRGDNMMRLHLEELEQKAEEILTDAETVDIRREFPHTLVIDVQKSIPAFNISYEYGTLIVSQYGKILEDSMDPVQGLVSIAGYVPAETTPGKRLFAEEERCDKIFSALQEIILDEKQEHTSDLRIVAVDMT
ncbi:MAG: FtsQ-type POTRA domain-containing protein, partial [Oscillospiraceae bacterium]|nr:FtsQ-type POTRA domain-containing protein [Oscillospiraceae bacterium]